MGLFNRKKGSDQPASVLSEGEIQQKLYGEFKRDQAQVAGAGDREISHESSSDLFTSPQEIRKAVHSDFSQGASFSGTSLKSVYSKPIEEKIPERQATVEDPYQKYNDMHQSFSKQEGPATVDVLAKIRSFFKKTAGLNQFFTRQVLYWAAGVLVVFLLFWGVNALNVGREQAMKDKYNVPAQSQTKMAIPSSKISQEKMLSGATQAPKKVSEEIASPISKPEETPLKMETVSESSAPVISTKRFVIQVVTYPTQDYAERIVASLKQAGFQAYVHEDIRPTGTTFYMVLIGSFNTASEAKQQLEKFRTNEISRPFSDAFVKTSA